MNQHLPLAHLQAHGAHLEVPEVLGHALLTFLHKTISMQLREPRSGKPAAEVKSVDVLAHNHANLASSGERQQGEVGETGSRQLEGRAEGGEGQSLARERPHAGWAPEVGDAARCAWGTSARHTKKRMR